MKMNLKKMKIIITGIIILIIIIFGLFTFLRPKSFVMLNFVNKDLNAVNVFVKERFLKLEIKSEDSLNINKGFIINQSIEPNTVVKKGQVLVVTVSNGKPLKTIFKEYKVNELGEVPIMMYHGIHNIKNDDTAFKNGNVDRDGYQRTAEAFRNDLEMYYKNNYRMIKLDDYIDGVIDVELGMSPIVITFDDGLINNIKVTGLDADGDIIIDKESAVGILEEFKEKYKDFNVTATFFLNNQLFHQPLYNAKIIAWLLEHDYSIGNHTYGHLNISHLTPDQTVAEVGDMYKKLDDLNVKYSSIVALPFGAPYSVSHPNFQFIIKDKSNVYNYQTRAVLRVGWESECSPFSLSFNKTFLKRIRAYDNNGRDFDIAYNFKVLEKTRYISDGNKNRIVIREGDLARLRNDSLLQIITY